MTTKSNPARAGISVPTAITAGQICRRAGSRGSDAGMSTIKRLAALAGAVLAIAAPAPSVQAAETAPGPTDQAVGAALATAMDQMDDRCAHAPASKCHVCTVIGGVKYCGLKLGDAWIYWRE